MASTQVEIDIAITNIKIHDAFTISDGTNSSVFATSDAVYTLTTFAAKLTTDLGYTVTAGGDPTITDTTPYYRLYLQFANAVTLTGMPKYIFNIPFSDFSVKAGGQVNLRNVNLDADMTIVISKEFVPQSQIGEDILPITGAGSFGFSSSINKDGTIISVGDNSYDGGKGRILVYKYKIPTTTEWDTTDIVMKGSDTGLSSPVPDKLYWTQRGSAFVGGVGEYTAEGKLNDSGNIIAIATPSVSGGLLIVYEYINDDWSQVGNSIVAPQDESNPNYGNGNALRINGDGTIVAWASKVSGVQKKALAYQFDGTTWNQLGNAMLGNNDTSGYSSESFAMNSSGYVIAAGASYTDVSGKDSAGEVFIYEYSNGSWTTIGNFKSSTTHDKGYFGWSVQLNAAGDILAVGAKKDDSGSQGGMVKVYQYSGSGTTWNQIGYIQGDHSSNEFGRKVALNPSGDILLAASRKAPFVSGSSTMKGLIRCYQYTGSGTTWNQIGSDILGDTDGDELGFGIEIRGRKFIATNYIYSTPVYRARVYQIEEAAILDTSTIPAGNHFINNFVNTIETDLVNYTLSYDEPNKRITFDSLAQDISMSITSTDTTIFDTSITEITTGANTLPFLTYGQPDPTIKDYSDNGITISEFLSNGYTIPQLLAENVIPDWTFVTNANHFDQSYLKGFTDVSGSVVIRNDNKLITNGELSLGGNLTINPTPPIQPDTITTLIPNSEFSNAESTIPIYDDTVSGNTEPAYVLSNVSITSLDQIEIVTSSMDGSAITGPISAVVYKYPEDPNGTALEGNWIIGIYDGDYNKSAKIVFTLNGTTPSIQQTGQCHYQGIDLTTSAADLISLYNDSNYNANARETNYGYKATGLTYRVIPAPVAQPQGSVSLVIDDMTLKSQLLTGEDISANGKVYIGGDLSVNGQFSGDFLNNSIPESAILFNPIDISGNAIFIDDVSFNGPTVDVNLPLKITTTLIPDSDLTDYHNVNGTHYYQIPDSAPLVLTGVSIDSLDKIEVASVVGMTGINIGEGLATNVNFYKYETDANGNAVTGNIWIFGSLHSGGALTRACMIEFTLNGTTPSVQQIKRAFNTAYETTPMDYSTTSADLHILFNDSNIGSIFSTTGLNYSINGLTYRTTIPQKLQVNQIEFNDGTTVSTHDDNILSGTFADSNVVFKDSLFTAITCEGTATADSTTTSDYRIKENVTELNETDTVDALVPIQYNNTVSGNHEFGLLAHELQDIYPDLVNGEKDGDEYQQVNYNGLIGVLVKEVQDLKQRLAVLNNR